MSQLQGSIRASSFNPFDLSSTLNSKSNRQALPDGFAKPRLTSINEVCIIPALDVCSSCGLLRIFGAHCKCLARTADGCTACYHEAA